MKRVLISFVVIAAVALMASSQVQLSVTQVGDFNKLSLVDDINVNYRCNPDSAGYILLTCTKELADHVIFTYSSSGRLSIQVDDDLERMRDLPTITVYSKSLDEADNAGDSTLRITGLPPLKSFKVRNIDKGKLIGEGGGGTENKMQMLRGEENSWPRWPLMPCRRAWWGPRAIQADPGPAPRPPWPHRGRRPRWVAGGGANPRGRATPTEAQYDRGTTPTAPLRKLGTIKAIPME